MMLAVLEWLTLDYVKRCMQSMVDWATSFLSSWFNLDLSAKAETMMHGVDFVFEVVAFAASVIPLVSMFGLIYVAICLVVSIRVVRCAFACIPTLGG